METINLQCNSPSQIATFKCLLQTKNSMTGAYMGEVLIQFWLKSMKKCMGELLDKQVNA